MSTSGAADREPGSDRKGGGRSRTGCAACKKRRRKCDEAKPSCNSCSLAGRVCTYPPPVPLRERRHVQHGRALPGQQTPWHLPVTAPDTPPNLKALMPLSPSIGQPLDPFDALPLSMPKKSLALFHYYASANDVHFSRPPFTAQNLLAYASQDGDILRNILFVASWHYLWNTGSLHDFATTYHVHKVESLQKVREWVDDASSRKNALKAVRAIATHCIVEISMGNFREAETHLKGLMTLTEVLGLGARSPKDLEGELMNRYVVVIINFMQGLRARALDSHRIEESHISSTIRRGYVEEKPGLAMRLAAVLRVPYFFIANSNGSLPPPVNARYVLDSFGDITKDVGERLRVSSRARRNEIWNTGTSGVAFAAILESHMASIASNWATEPSEDPEKPRLEAQWTPLVAATGLYFGIFLMLWDPGVVADCRIRRYLSLTIRQYVLSTRRKLSTWDDEHRCLWFWMAFLVALCNVIAPENERDAEWATLGTEMRMCIYDWSCLAHVTTWPDARAALVSMSWPTYLHLEAESASVWEASVSENRIPYRERPQ